jgi:hypothetical protein
MSLKSNKLANSKELFKHSFDIMQLLKQKIITVEEAKAQANLLKQSNNLLRYELDRAVAISKGIAAFENLEIRQIEDNEA